MFLTRCAGLAVRDTDRSGSTALHWAAEFGFEEVVGVLLQVCPARAHPLSVPRTAARAAEQHPRLRRLALTSLR